MVVRRNRLARTDFPTLLKYGKRSNTLHFSITYSTKVHGYAVVVGKKVIKTSVGRHKLKRRVQNILNTTISSYGYTVFARKGAGTLSFFEIQEELGTLLIHTIT